MRMLKSQMKFIPMALACVALIVLGGCASKKFVQDGTILKVLDGPEEADGLTWWRLEDPKEEDEDLKIGWGADEWLEPTLP